MTASQPDSLSRLFAERANAGDLDGMLALYERDATYLGPDGVPAAGGEAIRERLRDLLAISPRITPLDSETVRADDVALIRSRWRASFGEDAQASYEGLSVEVARRQGDGRWLYVIDNPTVDDRA
jgi:uncharacterized protein (TIGR02246 family)